MSEEGKKRVQEQVLKNRLKAFQDAYELPLDYPPSGDLPTAGASTKSLWDMTDTEHQRERDLVFRSISELAARYGSHLPAEEAGEVQDVANSAYPLEENGREV